VRSSVASKLRSGATFLGGALVASRDWVTSQLAGYSLVGHGHAIADVTSLQSALDNRVLTSDARLSDARTPLTHTHTASDISDATPSGRDRLRQNPLGPWDFWQEDRFHNATSGIFQILAISSGNFGFSPGASQFLGYNAGGIAIRSSTTANSGGTIAGFLGSYFFGQMPFVFRAQLSFTDLTNLTVRAGWHNANTVADSSDGCYFEIVGSNLVAKTASNSTRTTHPTSLTVAVNTPYTLQIDISVVPLARFRVWSGTNETPIFDQSIDTNVPSTSARTSMPRITMTNSGTVATTNIAVWSMGVGTLNAFTRARL
jgi:hypothetical protein